MSSTNPWFQRSWLRVWHELGLDSPAELFERLLAAYSEPQRHYHTLQHLAECLELLEEVRGSLAHPAQVELALWFHDAVYDVKAKDNEEASARWAASALLQAGASAPLVERVTALIMATAHQSVPIDTDEQTLVDIDLSILGAPPARFEEYDAQIRAEYGWVPEDFYRVKRAEVLQGFLNRTFIYGTPYFRDRCESSARVNLDRALKVP